uniref:RING-type E3 ubiquitin transferase n=1 Tax=Araucaria cunninghamii TaxID=56994 RepID=A0A0D6R3L3_ARACU
METQHRLLSPPLRNRLGELKFPLHILSPHLTNQSSTSLVRSLLLAAKEIESLEKPKQWHPQQAACITRRIKLLSLLFDELYDKEELIVPPSATVSLRELLIAIQKSKVILQELCRNKRSRTWQLMEGDLISRRLEEINRDMGKALEMLPLGLLPLSEEVREHVGLLRRQTANTDFVASQDSWNEGETRLRCEVEEVMDMLEAKGAPDPERLSAAFAKLSLDSLSKCRAEIRKLQNEASLQVATESGVSALGKIQRLIGLLVYAKSALFDAEEDEEDEEEGDKCELVPCSPSFRVAAALSCSRSIRSYSAIPDEMKCPISLDLMRDPVIVASGHTYDRASISEWLDSGHSTCPLSGQKLPRHPVLIPNYALRSLISQWCDRHNVPFHFSSEGNGAMAAQAAETVKTTVAYLVGKLATGSPEVQRQAAHELRLLAKCGNDNRKRVAEAGAIPLLVHLLSSSDAEAQENAVTALLNVSIYDNNKVLIMAAPGAVDGIVGVIERGGTMEGRENAAATIFSLAVVEDYKISIGGRSAAIPALVRLLREGSTRGKKDAATALYNLSVYKGNRPLGVRAGAVPVLLDLVVNRDNDSGAGVTNEALAALSVLAGCLEGLAAIESNSVPAIPVMTDLVREGNEKGKENAMAVLAAMCKTGGEDMVKRLLAQYSETIIPALQIVAWTGSPQPKRKANSLLNLLHVQLKP